MRNHSLLAALGAALLLPALAAAQSGPVTVTLATQNSSGVSGTATLTQKGTDLEVVIALTGAQAGSNHPFHIHTGVCPSPGGVAHPLTNAMDGKSTTLIANTTLASVSDGQHSINGHSSPDNMAAYIACGNIPAAAAMPSTLPKTGGGGAAMGTEVLWLLLFGVLVLLGFATLRLRTQSTR